MIGTGTEVSFGSRFRCLLIQGYLFMRYDQVKQNICGLILLVCFCFCSGGCGKKQNLPDDMPKPFPTVITVIQDEKPLEGASIALIPADASNSWHAGAMTDTTGNASLKTLNQYEGVVPGKYRIIITKRESDKSRFTSPPDQATDPQGYAKFMQDSAREKLDNYDLIDPKFGKISADTEMIDVVEGKNEKTIDVGKAVRQKR